MRILHYSLGVYPHRVGGMNRYCTDLMREQSKTHEVALLYPRGYSIWNKWCFISKPDKEQGIVCYRLKNAEPVPVWFGIKKPDDFYGRQIDIKSFDDFYRTFRPNVLHLHTLMGLPIEALKYFKDKGVRIVYTSHDYFGICPKINLIDIDGKLCDGPSVEKCIKCNKNAPSTFFLKSRNRDMVYMIKSFMRWIKNLKHC